MEPEELLRNLIEHGHMPPWLANHVVEIQTMSRVVPESPNDTVRRLLGREPRKLEAFSAGVCGEFPVVDVNDTGL
ncbi:hypothetical protein ACFSQ7_01465 [Paenibacillus rhizoplanae]